MRACVCGRGCTHNWRAVVVSQDVDEVSDSQHAYVNTKVHEPIEPKTKQPLYTYRCTDNSRGRQLIN